MAANEGMGLVPRHDSFIGLNGHHFPNEAGINDLLYLPIKRGKAQDKADHDSAAGLAGQTFDVEHLADTGGDGLFQQHVASQFQSSTAGLVVVTVLGGDQDDIGQLPRRQQLFAAGKSSKFRIGREATYPLDPFGHRVGAGNNPEAIRKPARKLHILTSK